MKKMISVCLLASVLMVFSFLLSPCCFALGQPALIVDSAGVLSSDELASLTQKAESIRDEYSCDVAVVFTAGYRSSSIMTYTDDFFDYNGYGYGSSKDGVMLLVDVVGREYWISTSGSGIYAFTDAGQLYLKDLFVSRLSAEDWAGAADAFLSGCAKFLQQAQTGEPYDVGNMPRNAFNLTALLGSTGAGLLLGGLPLMRTKKSMKTVEEKTDAGEYIYGRAPVLTRKSDRFVNKHTARVPIVKNTGPHGGGGGSSIHMGSSGNYHGGSGGHF